MSYTPPQKITLKKPEKMGDQTYLLETSDRRSFWISYERIRIWLFKINGQEVGEIWGYGWVTSDHVRTRVPPAKLLREAISNLEYALNVKKEWLEPLDPNWRRPSAEVVQQARVRLGRRENRIR